MVAAIVSVSILWAGGPSDRLVLMPDGRFAPSPTAPLHVGNLRTALIGWLCARRDGGRHLLRIEDLDPVASRPEHVQRHLADLTALGLDWDGDPVRQSQRRPLYDRALARLEDLDLLYPCYCTRREAAEAAQAPHEHLPDGAYAGTCAHLDSVARSRLERDGRTPAWRVRAGAAQVTVIDALAGTISGVVDDFVVRRRDGVPAYNLAVVVDDADQGIVEVVRGDDLRPGTPRQAWLADVLGQKRPSWVHVPLVVGPDGERLAKRHGAVTLTDLEAVGVTAAMLLAHLAASIGLCEPDDTVTADGLRRRFTGDRAVAGLGGGPWMFTAPPVDGADQE